MTKIKSAVKSASRRIPKTARAVVPVPAAELVTPIKGQPMTDSLLVAVEFGKSHKHVLRSIDALQVDLSPEFWRSNFGPSTYTDERGKAQRMFSLTQAGFTALVMGFTGKKSVQLRERFIVAFARVTAELQRLKAMQSAPSWQAARVETKRDFCNVTDMLQEVRADAGKDTKPHIFINESKLLRFAMTGNESAKWDRDTLSREDLKLLGKVERLDMRLIARGVPFHDRKASCRALVLEARGLLMGVSA